jgi:FtsP/CotA-like multicopper oxidase with cupredoxin domain
VPEYFADHALVNGVLWPKKTVAPGWYRIRLVDGSDARCFNLTFGTAQGTGNGLGISSRGLGKQGAGEAGIQVTMIATEQGYLNVPIRSDHVTMCPGERYEFLVDFSPFAGQSIFMNNNAAAPYPDGVAPQDPLSPFSELATIMRFDVQAAATAATGPAVPSCGATKLSWDPARTPAQNGVGCVAVQGVLDRDFKDLRTTVAAAPPCPGQAGACVAADRVLFLSEKVDGETGSSLGLQINGMPFEYDVTETPKQGTYESWHIVNTTVDAHPMHPHLGKYQIVRREAFDVGCYKTLLCGTPTCAPGAAPGGVLPVIPDYRACLTPTVAAYPIDPEEAGWKDAMRSYPGEVLTFVGKWDGAWSPQVARPNAPGAGHATNPGFTTYPVGSSSPRDAKNWTYAAVTSGPYVWHCHINSHEDSEMMRTSLVVK